MSKHNRMNAAQLEAILARTHGNTPNNNVVRQTVTRSGGDNNKDGHKNERGGWGEGGWDAKGHHQVRSGQKRESRRIVLPVVMHVECRDLLDMDLTSRSDPFVVVYIARLSTNGQVGWVEVGRTETVWDCLDPVFVKSFNTSRWSDTGGIKGDELANVMVKVEVYDNDDKESEELSKHDYIGAAKCKMDQVLKAQNMNLELRLRNVKRKNPGFITLMAEMVRMPKLNYEVTMLFTVGRDVSSGLKKAFIMISRALKGGKWTPVYRTETIVLHKGMLRRSEGDQREFKPAILKLDQLTAGVDVKPLRIELWKYKRNGSHERLGIAHTHYEQLRSLRLPYAFNMRSQNPSEIPAVTKSADLEPRSRRKGSLRSYASGFGSRSGIALGKSSNSDHDQVLVLQDRHISNKNASVSFSFRLLNF